ncbi:hypothetical protein P7K49_034086 [Saguinus oedipus]|uniref:Uncharacterized protein n=1 Tax=Saguinus oedipus TaxID=9490 RepID=A0ABQ9TU96_SAGOE|nr:hypothetical protein P7K49_034086 [Saguinus oedipus]
MTRGCPSCRPAIPGAGVGAGRALGRGCKSVSARSPPPPAETSLSGGAAQPVGQPSLASQNARRRAIPRPGQRRAPGPGRQVESLQRRESPSPGFQPELSVSCRFSLPTSSPIRWGHPGRRFWKSFKGDSENHGPALLHYTWRNRHRPKAAPRVSKLQSLRGGAWQRSGFSQA